jgi:hypothetical protein
MTKMPLAAHGNVVRHSDRIEQIVKCQKVDSKNFLGPRSALDAANRFENRKASFAFGAEDFCKAVHNPSLPWRDTPYVAPATATLSLRVADATPAAVTDESAFGHLQPRGRPQKPIVSPHRAWKGRLGKDLWLGNSTKWRP